MFRSDHAEEERPPAHSLSNSKLRLQGLEEEEEVEGDDEEEEEGSLTEKSHDEAPESPSPVTTAAYEEDEEEEEAGPLAMNYEHTRRLVPGERKMIKDVLCNQFENMNTLLKLEAGYFNIGYYKTYTKKGKTGRRRKVALNI